MPAAILPCGVHSPTSNKRVPRVDRLTAHEIEREHLARGRPVVWSGAAAAWPAARWTLAGMIDRAGEREVDVAASSDGRYGYSVDGEREFPRIPMLLRDAARWIEHRAPGEPHLYVMQQPLIELCPELMNDLDLSALPASIAEHDAHFWLGGAGTVAPLHYDPVHNVYAQVYGCKRMLLFSPDDLAGLDPNPITSEYPHVSRVDPEDPDLLRSPAFAAFRPWEVDLDPGDLLILPAFSWHHVRAASLSMSVNLWFAPGLGECLHATGLRAFEAMYRLDRFRSAGDPLRSCPGGLTGEAWPARAAGRPRFAALFTAAALAAALDRPSLGEGARARALTALEEFDGAIARRSELPGVDWMHHWLDRTQGAGASTEE